MLRDGTIIGDRFTVERQLGVGGSAIVYRAHDRLLDRSVALKLLNDSVSDADRVRFEREIRLTARLVHPAIVPLFDSGWHEQHLYYVMPCVVGETLREVVTAPNRLSASEAIRLTGDVAEALAYAHTMGFLHRDIKPENIFRTNGRALVADFGIARAAGLEAAPTAVTEAGIVIGTVAYMSPEQALGEPTIDGRSDLYALGCVLLELLTGEPPFRGPTAMSVLSQHITTPADVARRIPGESAELIRLLTDLLAKDPAARPSSAGVVVETLRALASETRVASPSSAAMTAARDVIPEAETKTQRTIREARAQYSRGVQGGDGARETLELGRVLAERALAAEPQNVVAMAVLADILHCQGFRGFTDEATAYREAQKLRMAGVAIDDSVGELQESIGVERLYWGDDFFGAERYLERGAALSPDDGVAQRHYATWLKMAGRFDDALRYIERAVTLSVDSPHALVGHADILMAMGRYVEAIAPLRNALRLMARYDQALERLEMACHRAGRFDDAFDARSRMFGLRRLVDRRNALTATFDTDGWEVARSNDLGAELHALLLQASTQDAFTDRGSSRQLSDRIIMTAGELGQWTLAMDWVEQGYLERPGRLIRVLTDLPFDRRGLASDRRYARMLRMAGLEFLL